MKQLQRCVLWLLLAAISVLTGCAGFSPYSISENELERHLQDVVADFDREQLQTGSPLSVSLADADVTLGPDGREVVVVAVHGQVAVNALLTRLPVDIMLEMEGTPVYDRQEKAIYIRRLQLLESRIDSPLFSGDLAPVTDHVMRLVAQMLETMPVYRLDDSSLTQRLLGQMPVAVRVAPGRLELVMDDQ